MTVHTTSKAPVVACAINGTELKLTFQDGRTLALDARNLSGEIQDAAMMHGLKQKLVDAAAIARDTVTGRSATLGDKYDAVREVFDRITTTSNWNKIRASGEGASPKGGLFVRALMQLGGKTQEQIRAQLESLTKEQVSALRTNKRVVEAMAALREETTDSDDILESILAD